MYRLENLSSDDFEELVNTLCQQILGTGVVSFTKGKDGGRDGRFEGTANAYPSKQNPWSGKFIIQAKHTTDYNTSCSDNDFYSNQTSIINKEIPKIIKLKNNGEADNYLLFTNRKETTEREKAVKHIKTQTSLQNVDIIGIQTIENWLKQHSNIRKLFGLDKFEMPFTFYEKDIQEVITIFHQNLPQIKVKPALTIDRPEIHDKNLINDLDVHYYEQIIKPEVGKYFTQIEDFLQDPKNTTYQEHYSKTATELKRVIEIEREQFDNFKHIFQFLARYIFDKDEENLKKYRNLIATFFHFMYYQCDIGREK